MGEIYEVAVELGSGAMIYIPSFIKIGSAIQKLIGGIHRYTYSMVISFKIIKLGKNGKFSVLNKISS
jgi:hypothetical protein